MPARKYGRNMLDSSCGLARAPEEMSMYLFLIFKNIGHHFNCSSVISNKQDIAQN